MVNHKLQMVMDIPHRIRNLRRHSRAMAMGIMNQNMKVNHQASRFMVNNHPSAHRLEYMDLRQLHPMENPDMVARHMRHIHHMLHLGGANNPENQYIKARCQINTHRMCRCNSHILMARVLQHTRQLLMARLMGQLQDLQMDTHSSILEGILSIVDNLLQGMAKFLHMLNQFLNQASTLNHSKQVMLINQPR
ncbi:hypothetical protein HPP92_009093 [Vanilla planifolia]|uniref:Uncharacterized protein n=1 Tax=Vanilla planifolia TaxID=51239 RepID=A0A835V729_VANPL|nr:hypothetical protein HPP92_009093 [Vanilla planifolia]